jgi:hypothetical protein
LLVAVGAVGAGSTAAHALGSDLLGPPGSQSFGQAAVVLPNGNYVVTDPFFDSATAVDVGAVYLYSGSTNTVISALTGSTAGDKVGSGNVWVLSNGNYVVPSTLWDSGAVADVGAVTWGSATSGVSGVVSASNSLIGSITNDQIGYDGATALPNGNYVVASPSWHGGVGAVTWGNGASGTAGVVSAANSLVGSTAGDRVGDDDLTVLSNGNYVVPTSAWHAGGAADVGAVTWGSAVSGVSGVVSAANSLVGSTTGDQVGGQIGGGVTVLSNGNYVVSSPLSDAGGTNVGAATWGNGVSGTKGVVSAANSLVGLFFNDLVGSGGVTALSNGN